MYNPQPPPDWKKEIQHNVPAFPGAIVGSSANIYERQIEAGNPDAYAYNQQVYSYLMEKGYPVLYYPYIFDHSKTEQISGEHSAAVYGKPLKLYMSLEIKDTPSWVEIMGDGNGDTFTAKVHIQSFKEAIREILADEEDERYCQYRTKYNPNYEEEQDWIHAIEPTPKDLIQLMFWETDREKPRGNRIFEVTNVEDEIFSENFNNNFGHYIWKLTGVRYRYSYEDNLSTDDPFNDANWAIGQAGEKGNFQLHDNMPVAKMFLADNDMIMENGDYMKTENDGLEIDTEKGTSEESINYEKTYDDGNNITELSKQVFDMEEVVDDIYKPPHIETNGFL